MQTSKENEKWTLFGLSVPMLFSSKENAELMKQFIVDKSHPSVKDRLKKTIFVGRMYEDANISKIKAGAIPYVIKMERDGKVLECKPTLGETGIFGKFGFTSGRIEKIFTSITQYKKIVLFKCIATGPKEAEEKANAYRIKTLLDDIWFKDHDNNLL